MNRFNFVLIIILVILLIYFINPKFILIGGGLSLIILPLIIRKSNYGKSSIKKFGEDPRSPIPKVGGKSKEEIEARWLDIDEDTIRKKLICEQGCSYVHGMKKLIRILFYHPKIKKGYIRIRREFVDDYHPIIYLTAKEFSIRDGKEVAMEDEIKFTNYDKTKKWLAKFKNLNEIDNPEENSFDDIANWMKRLGFEFKTYTESFRKKFKSSNCKEIVIDLVPGLNPYIEIECDNGEELFATAKKLGLKKEDAIYGGYGNAYAVVYSIDVDIPNNKISEFKFDNIDQHLGKFITDEKARAKFDETFEKYRYII